MAKKIVWSKAALHDRYNIYQFWIDKNKSDLYSKKLEMLFNEGAKLLSEFPEIGTETDFKNVRVKIIRDYKLFYLNEKESVQIIRVWDSRQHGDKLKFK